MHELAIALGIVDIAAAEAERKGYGAIKTVYLTLGPLSGVVPSALVSAFEFAREKTPLEGSKLVIEETPLVVFCPTCQSNRTLPGVQDFVCPMCQTPCGEVLSGRELEIRALEVAA